MGNKGIELASRFRLAACKLDEAASRESKWRARRTGSRFLAVGAARSSVRRVRVAIARLLDLTRGLGPSQLNCAPRV